MYGNSYSNKGSIPKTIGEEEKLNETMFLLNEVCKQSSSAYVDLGLVHNDLNSHFKSNTLRSPLKTSSQMFKRAKAQARSNNSTVHADNSISFMDKNHEGISVKQIVSGRQHMYVSNLIGFEVFTTKESKEALDAAADLILNIEHDVDGNNINKMWEVIQAFFNAVPLIHFDTDNEDGRARFARYIQTMETLKEIIRKMVFENYKRGMRDTSKLTPYFIACRLAESDIQNLENEIKILENKLEQSVGTTKEEIISAFKNLNETDQVGLRQYFAKDGSFSYPKTPPINATRHYGENRPFDKAFNDMVMNQNKLKLVTPPENVSKEVSGNGVKSAVS